MDAQTLLWFVLIPLAVVLLVRKLTASNPPPKPAATNKKKPAGMGKTVCFGYLYFIYFFYSTSSLVYK